VDDVMRAVLAGERRIVVFDVEATCWKKGVFSRLPRLSSFCRELTGITQDNVDAAPTFPEALRLFLEWLQPFEPVVLATWSRYDLWQLDLDLEAHGLPQLAIPVLDVKKLAARIVGKKSIDDTARELDPDSVSLPSHRAVADARRTAKILSRLLRPLV
jgi:inhibitor of KinA sporulation pathway (predicted exonuclease)